MPRLVKEPSMPDIGSTAKPRVLSGITATGKLHIGNYIGALSVWAGEQDRFENFFFIADLHALTDPESVRAGELRGRIREIAALYLACGLDVTKSVLFLQSQVPAHATLCWIFDCVTPVGWLERMTQYKSKSERVSPSAGLLTYPALMAADILLYQADYVPVGADQRQHVELTRDIAQRFNHLFGEAFVVPQALIRGSGARIMGLDDPSAKMSKSVAQSRDGHAIGLLDPPATIRRAVMRAVTDSRGEVTPGDLSAGVDNLLVLFEVLSGTTRAATLSQFAGRGYGVLKEAVAEVAIEHVSGIQARYGAIRADEGYLDSVLAEGAERASAVAGQTLRAALRLTGLA
jgi:tryptophanyl-tRNA synthetase